jgi:glycosyltransferase involved in cell wall biosynthesis
VQRIAVVAPSSYPFALGGAEKLWLGLVNHINSATGHVADLVKLPSPESDLRSIVASYADFSRLDLSGFDVVISTKYPAWMVSHPRHVCYLQHRLRGLYDTYNAQAFGTDAPASHPGVAALLRFMRENAADRDALPAFFERFHELATSLDTPPAALAFPGPLARDIVRFMDGCALQVGNIARFATISRNVARRHGYFPMGVAPAVVNHPSNLTGFRCGSFDYLFTASRLDGPKRIALLVEAMRHVKSDIRLKIAGTGPDGDRIRDLARADARIEFLGFVRDEDMVGFYADALAVPYVPLDEDYGLVTVEAMACGKPVITCNDSGGTLGIVADGENGFVVAPDPRAIAARIDELARARDRARAMGERGRERVAGITWKATLETLLDGVLPRVQARRAGPRRRITVVNTYPVSPPRSGGSARIFHLYGQLARHHDVDLIVFADHGEESSRREARPGMTETRVAFSPEHVAAEKRLRGETGFLQIADVAMIELAHLTPEFGAAVRESAARSDLVIASHPYLFAELARAAPGKPLGHESQNAEYLMKKSMVPDNAASRRLLERLRETEGACCREARFILACSDEDRDALKSLYAVPDSSFIMTPNGVDTRDVEFASVEKRRALRARLGFGDCPVVLFMGSWHGPNVAARDRVLTLAAKFPQAAFFVMGSVCQAPFASPVPENVRLLGVVDDDLRKLLFQAADVGLNPMAGGSGTNVKMLDYLAAGLPVVTTPFGARGLFLENGVHAYVVADERLEAALAGALAADETTRAAMSVARDGPRLKRHRGPSAPGVGTAASPYGRKRLWYSVEVMNPWMSASPELPEFM